jgi:hypothetical protein
MGFYGNATYYLPNGTAKYIETDAVTTTAIASNQVYGSGKPDTKNHIAPASIGTHDIAEGAITDEKLKLDYL